MKKALIHGERICEVRADTFPVAEPLFWVDVPDDTTTRDTWDGTQVVKYVPPEEASPLADWQAERKRLYRERIASYKNTPGATHVDVMGFVMDAQIKAQAGDAVEFNDIKAIIDQVKAEVPNPSP